MEEKQNQNENYDLNYFEYKKKRKKMLITFFVALFVVTAGSYFTYLYFGSGTETIKGQIDQSLKPEDQIDGLELADPNNWPPKAGQESALIYTGKNPLKIEYPDNVKISWINPGYDRQDSGFLQTVFDRTEVFATEIERICFEFTEKENAGFPQAIQCLDADQVAAGKSLYFEYLYPGAQEVEITVYDRNGHEVRDFIDDEFNIEELVTVYKEDEGGGRPTTPAVNDSEEVEATELPEPEISSDQELSPDLIEQEALVESGPADNLPENQEEDPGEEALNIPDVPYFNFEQDDFVLTLIFHQYPFPENEAAIDQICADFDNDSPEQCMSIDQYNEQSREFSSVYSASGTYKIKVSIKSDGEVMNTLINNFVADFPTDWASESDANPFDLQASPSLQEFIEKEVEESNKPSLKKELKMFNNVFYATERRLNQTTVPPNSYIYINAPCADQQSDFIITQDQKSTRFSILANTNCQKNLPAVVRTEEPVEPTPEPEPEPAPEEERVQNSATISCTPNTFNPEPGETVFFDASATDLSFDHAIWELGDGTEYVVQPDHNQSLDLEYIYRESGSYRSKLTLYYGEETLGCQQNITVEQAPEATQCNDGIDNDSDGLIDMGEDPGCKSFEDDNEVNGIARVVTACSDGIDNDNDGFVDTADLGCQNAGDDNERNPNESIRPGGEADQQFCLEKSAQELGFEDIASSHAEDVILDFAHTFYNGDDRDFKGTFLVQGYDEDGDRLFKPDQPIRRDEALKILAVTSCFVEHVEVDDTEYAFEDPEFENDSYWAKKVINRAANGGLIKKQTRMHPESNVTRAEFMKMLVNIDHEIRGTEIEECEKGDNFAVDVLKRHWFCRYAKTANELGIAGGTKDIKGNLRLYPNAILTREDALIWLNNYLSIINQ